MRRKLPPKYRRTLKIGAAGADKQLKTRRERLDYAQESPSDLTECAYAAAPPAISWAIERSARSKSSGGWPPTML